MTISTLLSGFRQRLGMPALHTLILLFSLLFLNIEAEAQSNTYSFKFDKTPLENVIAEVTKKTGYEFIFDANYLKGAKPLTVVILSATANQVFDAIFKGQNFTYEVSNKTIIVKPIVKTIPSGAKYTISGQVIDSLGIAIPGALVRVKGSSLGVQTNAEGRFLLNVEPKNNTLLFNYIGYNEKELDLSNISNNSKISIVLSSNTNLLDEIFVNGFQSITKERVTAAYTTVNNEKLNEHINVDLLSALEGKVAGLQLVKNVNGVAADQPVLRGIGTFSFNVGTSPLIVIDGLPTEYTLDEVNPYDIESVTVLKDAAAASIYGSRSANGVIVLVTKQGKLNTTKITFNADLFITQKPDVDKMHYASTSDLIDFETAVYNAERARYTTTENMFAPYGDINNGTIKYYSPLYQLYRSQANGSLSNEQVNSTLSQWRNNDYIKQYTDNVWQNEVRKRYNLSLSSASSKSNTYFSLNYDEGQGRVINNKNQSFNINYKSTYNFKKWLTATFGINGTYAKDEETDGDYNNFDFQERYAQILDPNGNRVITDYVNLSDGFTSGGGMNGAALAKVKSNAEFKSFGFNILNSLNEGITTQKYTKLRTYANLQAKITEGLSFNTQFQYENSSSNRESYYDAASYKMRYAYNMMTSYNTATSKYVHNLPDGGRLAQLDQSSNNYTFRNQLSFNRGFGKNKEEHYFSAIAGMELRQTMIPLTVESQRYGYDPVTLTSVNLDNNTLNTGGISSYFGGTKSLGLIGRTQTEIKHRFASVFANAGYTYQGK